MTDIVNEKCKLINLNINEFIINNALIFFNVIAAVKEFVSFTALISHIILINCKTFKHSYNSCEQCYHMILIDEDNVIL